MKGIEWLTSLGTLGMRLGLENITELLRRLGDPHKNMRTIHVAGTDGKGSTCAMIHSVLMHSGYDTGLYTSPHITRMNERIRVNDSDITDERMEAVADEVRVHAEAMLEDGSECTFFEVMTAMAFVHFKKNNVKFAVIETGLGGRFDATNVIVPDVSVITNISLEHTSVLGDTIEKIAFEKSGIIKNGVPAVTANGPPALDVITSIAKERGSEITVIEKDRIRNVNVSRYGTSMEYDDAAYEIGIPSSCQAENAAVAVETLKILSERHGLRTDIKKGLAAVRWEGRMEPSGNIIFDVSHTLDGTRILADDIEKIYGKVMLVIGMLDDKDANGISKNLSGIAEKVFASRPNSERAASAETVAEAMRRYHGNVEICGDVGSAMENALAECGGKMILVTGSFYMAEDAKRWLKARYA